MSRLGPVAATYRMAHGSLPASLIAMVPAYVHDGRALRCPHANAAHIVRPIWAVPPGQEEPSELDMLCP